MNLQCSLLSLANETFAYAKGGLLPLREYTFLAIAALGSVLRPKISGRSIPRDRAREPDE